MRLFLPILLLLITGCVAVHAQSQQTDPFIQENTQKRSTNPEGVIFTVRLKDNRKQFYPGEIIRLELSFASSIPQTYNFDNAGYDRSGRLMIDSFILDRSDGVVDPLHDYFYAGLGPFDFGGLRGFGELTDKPRLINAELNEWKRLDKPAHYRLYVVSHRVGAKTRSIDPLANGKPVASNVVEFEILPADKKWANQKLNEATAALSKPLDDDRSPCRTLRFLSTMAAASEMVRRFRGDHKCDYEYQFGLIGSPHRHLVIREMEKTLSSPQHPVSGSFLYVLTLLELTRQQPAPPSYPVNGTDEQVSQWQTQQSQRRSAFEQLQVNYARQLLAAIPQKEGQARATSLQTILDYRSTLKLEGSPQWPALLAAIPEVFSRLPLDEQVRMLSYQWKPIANAAMIPVLREVLKESNDNSGVYEQWQLRNIALRRLYEMSPEEGRQIIIEDIRRPKPRFSTHVLTLLPDETLPELNGTLAESLKGSGSKEVFSDLVERYATDEILPQVRSIFEGPGVGRWACAIQAPLLAYFLRVDPSSGGEYLNQALAARGGNFTRCYAMTLVDVAERHMSAEVEAAAIASLEDKDPEVASQAARVLGEFGSENAERPLWLRLEKWHDEMRSQGEQLKKVSPGLPGVAGNTELSGQALIEQDLLKALGAGRGWLSDPEKLKRLRDLCLTKQGCDQVERMILDWDYSIGATFNSYDDEISSIGVAHYSLKSIDSLKEKLLQFPKGTLFEWGRGPSSNDPRVQKLFQEIKTHLEQHGMKLEWEAEPQP